MNRTEMENCIKSFAGRAVIIELNPVVHTHMGDITMLDESATCIQEVESDWVILGKMKNLTDDELKLLYSSVQVYAGKLLKSFCSR